jgi:hypothetical protein
MTFELVTKSRNRGGRRYVVRPASESLANFERQLDLARRRRCLENGASSPVADGSPQIVRRAPPQVSGVHLCADFRLQKVVVADWLTSWHASCHLIKRQRRIHGLREEQIRIVG